MTESKPLPQDRPKPNPAKDPEAESTEISNEQLDKVSGGAVGISAGIIPTGDRGLL